MRIERVNTVTHCLMGKAYPRAHLSVYAGDASRLHVVEVFRGRLMTCGERERFAFAFPKGYVDGSTLRDAERLDLLGADIAAQNRTVLEADGNGLTFASTVRHVFHNRGGILAEYTKVVGLRGGRGGDSFDL
jgi:hypothetical protein